jgi:hypothetical protein
VVRYNAACDALEPPPVATVVAAVTAVYHKQARERRYVVQLEPCDVDAISFLFLFVVVAAVTAVYHKQARERRYVCARLGTFFILFVLLFVVLILFSLSLSL